MFQIISEKSTQLQQYIDNRQSDVKVGLRSITYMVGWYNIRNEFMQIIPKSKKDTRLTIPPGLYSFYDLQHILTNAGVSLTLEINKVNGIVTLRIPSDMKINLSKGLRSILGLTSTEHLMSGTYIGDTPVNFMPFNSLYIKLNQVKTENNIVNGAPSTVIAVVPASDKPYGKFVTLHYDNPEFKDLINGTITELNVQITDEHNRDIDVFPVNIVLEFKKNIQ